MIELSNTPVTEAELTQFLADINAKCREYFHAAYPTCQGDPTHDLYYDRQELKIATVGGKNIAVWCSFDASNGPGYVGHKPTQGRYTRSIYCFIDRATGDILKPAGCKGPVKGKRGNIREGGYWDRYLCAHGVINLR